MKTAAYLITSIALASPISAADIKMSPFDFTKLYLRQLTRLESLNEDARNESAKRTDSSQRLFSEIHQYTAWELAFAADANVMATVKLDVQTKEVEDLPVQLLQLYVSLGEVMDQMKGLTEEFLSGPKPGVDYGAKAAKIAELGAVFKQQQTLLIDMSALVFVTMVDVKHPDAQGHVSRLVITSQQRTELLASIQQSFGKRITQKGEDEYVSAAGVIYDYLHKGYVCSDEARKH
jgi:uncharacterized protein YxeA